MASKGKIKKPELTEEQQRELDHKNKVNDGFISVAKGFKKIDDLDDDIRDEVVKIIADDIKDKFKDLETEFEEQRKMELTKLTIAANQATRIDKVSDIAFSYYNYTGKLIDPELLSVCVEDLENNVLSASSLVSDWTFAQFCVDNSEWENPMNVLLPEYEPGMSVEDVWWSTYLFHDMSGHGQAASSLHMKIDELILRLGDGYADELRNYCLGR